MSLNPETVDEKTVVENQAQQSLLDRPVASWLTINVELLLWIALLTVAFLLRLYHVGVRAMSHDESLHTLYSYYLFNEGRYEHNPMMHGPFKFHITALVYFLFGDNDTTSRLMPALAGTALVWLMYFLRRYIGRSAAFIAGVLVAVSPSLLFHSRYIRDDIFMALWTAGWSYCAFRFLETRRPRWAIAMAVVMAFTFVTMENAFISGAIIGAFLVGLAIWRVMKSWVFVILAPLLPLGVTSYYYHAVDRNDLALLLIGVAAASALVLLVLGLIRTKRSWVRLRHDAAADLAVFMLALILPFMAPFGHLALHWDAMAYTSTQDILRSALLVAICAGASFGLAFYWFAMRTGDIDNTGGAPVSLHFSHWLQAMGVFWLVQVLFFTTFFTNTRNGLATGVVGSLGYWLAQQTVARGSQPWYYYPFIGSIYEFLPIILSIGGAIALLRLALTVGDSRQVLSNWQPVNPRALPANSDALTPEIGAATRIYFVVFGLVWTVGMWSAYTVAGEKMPWLFTHIALPSCILGAWWLGRLIDGVDWSRVRQTRSFWLIGAAPALLLLLIIVGRAVPGFDRSVDSLATTMRFLLAGLTTVGLIYLMVRWAAAAGWRTAGALSGLGLVALLFVLNTRASFMLNYINYDMATEYLVYAHAGPDVKRALAEIDAISERTVGDRNIVVAYDDDSSWPLSWYMRLYPNARFYGANPSSDSMAAPVVIVGPQNRDKVRPYVERDYVKRTYRLVWWPDMDYFNMTRDRLWGAISDPLQRERLWQIFMFRRHRDTGNFSRFRDLTQWPARHEFDMYVRRDLAAQIWDLGVTPVQSSAGVAAALVTVPEIEMDATMLYSGVYGKAASGAPDVALNKPRAVAVAPNGDRVIADSGNHRIVVLDSLGNQRLVFGSFCELGRGAEGGCVDSDGDGPLQLGDGQFNEPWGVAVDGSGQIFVADTWNGRIQVFDAGGKFLRKWGYFNTTNGELGDSNALFGPRGIAIDGDGNVLVADTGNKRLLRFGPQGEFMTQIGGGGVVAGRFDEPTDVAVDSSDGAVFVADAWNRRIQKFDATLAFVAEWPVPGWESKDIYHKPYLAVAPNGDVYASDPQFYRLFVYNQTGALKATFGRFGVETNRFGLPNGLAIDAAAGAVIVADADNNRVAAFSLVQ